MIKEIILSTLLAFSISTSFSLEIESINIIDLTDTRTQYNIEKDYNVACYIVDDNYENLISRDFVKKYLDNSGSILFVDSNISDIVNFYNLEYTSVYNLTNENIAYMVSKLGVSTISYPYFLDYETLAKNMLIKQDKINELPDGFIDLHQGYLYDKDKVFGSFTYYSYVERVVTYYDSFTKNNRTMYDIVVKVTFDPSEKYYVEMFSTRIGMTNSEIIEAAYLKSNYSGSFSFSAGININPDDIISGSFEYGQTIDYNNQSLKIVNDFPAGMYKYWDVYPIDREKNQSAMINPGIRSVTNKAYTLNTFSIRLDRGIVAGDAMEKYGIREGDEPGLYIAFQGNAKVAKYIYKGDEMISSENMFS